MPPAVHQVKVFEGTPPEIKEQIDRWMTTTPAVMPVKVFQGRGSAAGESVVTVFYSCQEPQS